MRPRPCGMGLERPGAPDTVPAPGALPWFFSFSTAWDRVPPRIIFGCETISSDMRETRREPSMASIKSPHKKSMKVKREAPEPEAMTPAERRRRAKADAKKTLSKTAKIVLVLIGAAAMLLSVTAMACSGVLNQVSSKQSYELTGGVAATVNGVNITEDTVTKQIMSTRTSGGYADDAAWAQYLAKQGLTPESYREQVINGLARQFLITQAVKDENVTVSSEDVDKAYNASVEQYGGADNFKKLIAAMGYTESTYRDNIRTNLEQQKLRETVAKTEDPTDDEVLSYFNANISTYNDARRSSNLLIKVDSKASDEEKAKAKEKAQGILDKINAGEISFEDAVKESSDDAGSKESGGDVGWDKLTRFVTEYQTALSALSKDQVSGIVETTYGYHIIKCTDVFKLDGAATSIDQLPSEFQTYIKNILKTQAETTAYNKWLTDYTEKADIKINPMPENVPYNVDLSLASQAGSAPAAAPAGSASE